MSDKPSKSDKNQSDDDPFILPKSRPPFLAKVAPGALVLDLAWRYFDWFLTAAEGGTRTLASVIKEATGTCTSRNRT